MARWDYTLDVKDIWNNFEDLGFEESRDQIVERVKSSKFYGNMWDLGLDDAVEGMENSSGLYAFNRFWNDFYDWADDNRVWVRTF